MATIERLSPGRCADPDRDHRRLSLDEAGTVFESLSSDTAQSIMVELAGDPTTTTTLADRVDTSIQNASYHLSRLEEADLVTVVGTRYSEKGREMKLYAPTVSSLVIGGRADAGDHET
jgi:DNA-binding transcriptional ArsR family regulator